LLYRRQDLKSDEVMDFFTFVTFEFINNLPMRLIAIFPLIFSFSAAFAQDKPEVKCAEISAQYFYSNVKLDPSIKIIDVRMRAEVRGGRIANSINIPLSKKLPRKAKSLDREATYYFYCVGGTRSCKAANQYEKAGFRHVYSLKGGINGWRKEGLPVKKGRR
jgi:rhodanese-related sulfurtransferase